ncbi:response regulator transcription factor [Pseudomonas sp. NPDC089401]|uniref:response regulator transcription factor n=1 Tax=Pseudomonas sp. NPDC089401 TaxID=3364462 RepID=UPI00382637CA
MRILIIEDNPDIVENLYEYFEPLGYSLDNAISGSAGLAMANDTAFDVIVLDGMLPGIDGLDVCRGIRSGPNHEVPILMLTARDTTQDKVDGLYAGADDYMVKPYSLIELEARIVALHRRSTKRGAAKRLSYGEIAIDVGTRQVTRSGVSVDLPPSSYKLLVALVKAAPELVLRETLEYELWQDDPPMSDALRTHVHSLRQLIDKPFPDREPILITVSGVGYRLAASNEEA